MTLNVDRISLWELGHRWHGMDPHQSNSIDEIPLEIKDTLRKLASEVYFERLWSDLLREPQLEVKIEKRAWKKGLRKAIRDFEKPFKDCISNNIIDPVFLKQILIPQWELEYWCKEYDIPFPESWVVPLWRGGSVPSSPESHFDKPNNDLSEIPKTSERKQKSEPHQKAAYARHNPTSELKRECLRYWAKHKDLDNGTELSNREAARRFCNQLSSEKKRISASTNIERLMWDAISDYKNERKEQWLIEFDPFDEI